MSTEISTHDDQQTQVSRISDFSELPGFDPTDPAMVFMAQIAHRWNMAKMLVKSGMIPQKTPEAAIAVMLKAHELGVSPMAGYANIYFFDGKLGMSADLMAAKFIQIGGKFAVLEWTREVCRIKVSRPDWEPSIVEYTFEDAKLAGLTGKPNWKNIKAMLSARARAIGIRLIAPDVFAGVYSADELADMAGRTTEEVAGLAAPGSPEVPQLQEELKAHAALGATRSQPAARRAREVIPEQEYAPEEPAAEDPAPEIPAEEQTAEEQDAADAFYYEAIDRVAALVDDMEPNGALHGHASAAVRVQVRRLAEDALPDGSPIYKQVIALVDNENLGRAQAMQLKQRLSLTLGAKPKAADENIELL
jgi:hypothetical protein